MKSLIKCVLISTLLVGVFGCTAASSEEVAADARVKAADARVDAADASVAAAKADARVKTTTTPAAKAAALKEKLTIPSGTVLTLASSVQM